MTVLRSVLYLVILYLSMTLVGLLFVPGVFLYGRKTAAQAERIWARIALCGLRLICGTRHEVRGLENVPEGPALIACKHQSMWETLFFIAHFKDPAIVLKKELLLLPLYGWYCKKLEMIVVDREEGASAIRSMARQAHKALAEMRPIIIFPEGTRQPPGSAPDYKPGIALLYRQLGLPCVPAALNSGLYWQGKGILRRPGRITIEFLPAIAPDLERERFMSELQARIEAACERLGREADKVHPQKRLNAVNA